MKKKLELVSLIQELESRYEVKKDSSSKDGDLKIKYFISKPKILQKTIVKSEIYISLQKKYNENYIFTDIYIKTYDINTRPKTLGMLLHKIEEYNDFEKLINLLNKFEIINKFIQYHNFNSIFGPKILLKDSYIHMCISPEIDTNKLQSLILIEIDEESVFINKINNFSINIPMHDFFFRDKLL